MDKKISDIKMKVLPILKKAGVKKSSLFGSVIRGEDTTSSDVDLLVEFPENKSLFEFIELQQNLEKALGRKIDLVEYSTIKPRLKKHILNNQIQIF